jgi:tRNA(Ile)-lysidine synthase
VHLEAPPVGDDEFAGLLDPLLTLSPTVPVGVAVSGGPDSTALCLLADHWARARGGGILAFTVDHGLRAGSTAEALSVLRRLGERGIPGRLLTWRAPPERAGQTAAREARYRLLGDACRTAGIADLLLGHSADDQVETVLMRIAHGTGLEGLAGISAVRRLAWGRVLRPLLGIPKSRLIATCAAFGVPFATDPANSDPRHERSRWRAMRPALDRAGWTAERLGAIAASAGRIRAATDRMADCLIAASATIHPTGYAVLDRGTFAAAWQPVATAALLYLVGGVGGSRRPLSHPSVETLVATIASDRSVAATLGRCRIAAGGGAVRICRETRNLPQARPVAAGERLAWDERFAIEVPADGPGGLVLAPTGQAAATFRPKGLPAAAWQVLPALWRDGKVAFLPSAAATGAMPSFPVRFRPGRPIVDSGFFVV